MTVELWLKLAAIAGLLVLSAFFSSLESAYFSLSRAILDRLGESADPRARRAAGLMADPRRMLSTILTGNTLVNTAAAAIAALLAIDLALMWGLSTYLAVAVEVVVITTLILFFGELLPKLLAVKNAERWALTCSSGAIFVLWILSPLAIPLARFTAYLSSLFGVERHSMLAMTEDEIRALVEVGHEHGALDLEERRLIQAIVEFGDTNAREVMVPRMDMVAVEKNVPLDELVKTVISRGHSRIPVYEGSIDNIIGLVHGKDLLKVAQSRDFDIEKLLRPAYFVPEEKKINTLLREFQSAKTHMAVVVDEYGGTAGLVTLEDIIEEIFGEIQDEYDREQPLIRRVDENTVVANALTGIYDLNETLGLEVIPENDAYDTLGGFVYSQLGVVPQKEQEFDFEGYRFVVEEVEGKRITRVRVIREGGAFEDV